MTYSLKQRTIIGGVAWAATTLLIGFFVLFSIIGNFADKNFRQTLLDRHNQIISALNNSGGDPDRLAQLTSDPVYQKPHSGVYWQVSNAQGVFLGSQSMFNTRFDIPEPANTQPEFWEINLLTGPVLGVRQSITLKDGSDWVVQVAETIKTVQADKMEIRKSMLTAFAIMGFLGVIGAVLQTSASLRPLTRMAVDVSKRKEDRKALNAKDYPQEVAPLVAELNELLDHNREIVDRGRRKVADLAHALKTPSSIIRNELAMFDAQGVDTRNSIEALDRIDVQTRRSLAKLRADNSKAMVPVAIPLRASVDRVIRYLMTIPQYQEKSVSIDIDAQTLIIADKQDLEEIIGNLAENALKWCNAKVLISANRVDQNITISIEDDGPGIPKDKVEKALQAGERLDLTVPGSGLGLSIVFDLLQSYSQTLELAQSDRLGGLKARFIFPAGKR